MSFNSKCWEHWSVSGSVAIAAISLGRDLCQEIGAATPGWYLVDTLILLVAVGLLTQRIISTGKLSKNIFGILSSSGDGCNLTEDDEIDKLETTVTASTQTNHRDYKAALERLKTNHHIRMSKVNKDIRQLRKHFSEKITKLKSSTKDVTKVMTLIQLKIPALKTENKFLTEERDALYTQIAEETTKQEEIHLKFLSLHSCMSKFGRCALTESVPDVFE